MRVLVILLAMPWAVAMAAEPRSQISSMVWEGGWPRVAALS
jgi:hypothetical protein